MAGEIRVIRSPASGRMASMRTASAWLWPPPTSTRSRAIPADACTSYRPCAQAMTASRLPLNSTSPMRWASWYSYMGS